MEESDRANGLKQKLQHYEPSTQTINLVRQTPILLLVGVSGAGKDSIKRRLLEGGRYHHIVSHTTREPRENEGVLERDGTEYHFIDLAAAEKMLDEGAFIEAKMYSGNVYGTSVAEIQIARDEGKIAVTDLEVQGVAEYVAISSKVKAVFVLPPSYEIWQARLEKRYDGKIHQHDLHRRMYTAKLELEEALHKDYFQFVINDDLEQALHEVDVFASGSAVIQNSEATRAVAEELLKSLTLAIKE